MDRRRMVVTAVAGCCFPPPRRAQVSSSTFVMPRCTKASIRALRAHGVHLWRDHNPTLQRHRRGPAQTTLTLSVGGIRAGDHDVIERRTSSSTTLIRRAPACRSTSTRAAHPRSPTPAADCSATTLQLASIRGTRIRGARWWPPGHSLPSSRIRLREHRGVRRLDARSKTFDGLWVDRRRHRGTSPRAAAGRDRVLQRRRRSRRAAARLRSARRSHPGGAGHDDRAQRARPCRLAGGQCLHTERVDHAIHQRRRRSRRQRRRAPAHQGRLRPRFPRRSRGSARRRLRCHRRRHAARNGRRR